MWNADGISTNSIVLSAQNESFD